MNTQKVRFLTKEMQAIGRTTEWHETQQKYEVSKANKRNFLEINKELEQANREMKVL